MDYIHEQTAKIFKALCDPKRVAIMAELKTGEKCGCMLIENLGLAQSALSYHMKILCESGMVTGRQEGKWVYYQISQPGASFAIDTLKTMTAVTPETTACDKQG